MSLLFEGVGFVRSNSNNIFDWRFFMVASLLFVSILIATQNANAQSSVLEKDRVKTGYGKQALTENDLPKDFNVVFYQSQSLSPGKLLVNDILKISLEKRFFMKRLVSKDAMSEMNYKLDSVWRKFDQRCRSRSKL